MEYLRVRVMLVGLIFAALTPLWTLMDALVLPLGSAAFLPMRLFMFVGLLACAGLAYRGHQHMRLVYVLSGLVFLLPAAFYAYLLLMSSGTGFQVVMGYGFIPFLLVATLSIFPFTLVESAVVGLVLLGLQVLASVHAQTWWTAAGWQDLWLLAALLVVSLTANYFHLGLLLRLYRQATHDALTGLLNRGALNQQVAQRPSGDSLHVLMIDLDHFKQINDMHGHSVGDDVLVRTAALLRRHVHGADLAARYGGEEFTLVLARRSDREALELAEEIRREVAAQVLQNHDRQSFRVTVSIGLAACPPGQGVAQALRLADERLYQAKRQGRNRVVQGGPA